MRDQTNKLLSYPVPRTPMIRYLSASFILFISLMGQPASAAWYQVEVIVFAQTRPTLEGEVWFENPGLPSRSDSIDLITAVPGDISKGQMIAAGLNQPDKADKVLIPYLELPEESQRLGKDFQILKLSADYRPLLHVTWEQPGYDADTGRAVHLEKRVETGDQGQELPPALAENQIKDDAYHAPEPVIDGTIRLRTTRFLHVDVDFAYFPDNFLQILRQQQQNAGNPQQLVVNQHADYVRLRESRKIKLNELHYFDHPLFGVLLQVTRLRD